MQPLHGSGMQAHLYIPNALAMSICTAEKNVYILIHLKFYIYKYFLNSDHTN